MAGRERKGRVSVGLTVNNTRILQAAKNNWYGQSSQFSLHHSSRANSSVVLRLKDAAEGGRG